MAERSGTSEKSKEIIAKSEYFSGKRSSRDRKPYDRENLKRAFDATLSGIRHPDLKNVQPQKLDLSRPRAKGASQEKIDNYFNELRGILSDNGLLNHPERIFNIDETGISTQHTPPNIVCGRETKPQAVTSPKSSNVTIIGGANALGNFVPPFYVFPGKRWNEKFIEGAPQGADGAMSDSGWSNSEIFETYVIEHLAKHASLNTSIDTPATLILYDGHRSHISLTLTEWAKKRNVVLFVLPPHTSHLTQPLDVGVFGPLKSYYYSECQQYLQKNPGISITKYEVAHLTSRPYLKAFCPENIISAFRKSGIYPFDDRCISVEDAAPASIYPKDQSATCAVNDEVEAPEVIREPENSGDNRESNSSQSAAKGVPLHVSSSFFDSKTITSVKQRPKKHFKPPYICGNLSNETNMGILQNQTSSRKNKPVNETKKSTKCKNDGQSKVKKQKSPQPSTSGTSKSGGPINLETPIFTDESDSDFEVDDGDKCCVCNMLSPTELKGCTSITFVKWGKCDFCPHWVHLKYCTAVKVLRRASIFRCPHCTLEE
ncbi:uncharacterized protein LOC128559893 [Mercenaria mercenaria]|uniref:uncharacterized protein LOC128559893 n=1 Tax=Mercenaria mercenaria TaxID=6596 RepID=UPI00234F0DB5|nr:uncharacterized protein LOC128559893 [Mercenaria mercenaria]